MIVPFLISIIANCCTGVSYVFQKIGLKHEPFYFSPLWLIGSACLAIGEILNSFSYTILPATCFFLSMICLIVPLGSISVTVNYILSCYLLGESLTALQLIGGNFYTLICFLFHFWVSFGHYSCCADFVWNSMFVLRSVLFLYQLVPLVCLVMIAVGFFLMMELFQVQSLFVLLLTCSLCGAVSVVCVKTIGQLTFELCSQSWLTISIVFFYVSDGACLDAIFSNSPAKWISTNLPIIGSCSCVFRSFCSIFHNWVSEYYFQRSKSN